MTSALCTIYSKLVPHVPQWVGVIPYLLLVTMTLGEVSSDRDEQITFFSSPHPRESAHPTPNRSYYKPLPSRGFGSPRIRTTIMIFGLLIGLWQKYLNGGSPALHSYVMLNIYPKNYTNFCNKWRFLIPLKLIE